MKPIESKTVFTLEATTEVGFVAKYLLTGKEQWIVAGKTEYLSGMAEVIRSISQVIERLSIEYGVIGMEANGSDTLRTAERDDRHEERLHGLPHPDQLDTLGHQTNLDVVNNCVELPDVLIAVVDIANRQEKLAAICAAKHGDAVGINVVHDVECWQSLRIIHRS